MKPRPFLSQLNKHYVPEMLLLVISLLILYKYLNKTFLRFYNDHKQYNITKENHFFPLQFLVAKAARSFSQPNKYEM